MYELFKCKYGSHLYGTATEKSDTDYKGIFLPEFNDLILQRVPKSVNNNTKTNDHVKNTSSDIDCEHYSLHYFLKMAGKGETCAIDMLHCNKENTLITSPEWEYIQENRARFYTKNVKTFVSYALGQCSKYGVKGSRLSTAATVLDFLKSASVDSNAQLSSVWDALPVVEHTSKIEYTQCTSQADKRAYQVCSKILMATTPIFKCIETLEAFYKTYGDRAKQASLDQGVDYKAVSHAFRAGFQIKEILETGDLKYPLKDADFLRRVKQGELKFTTDGLGEKLEYLIASVEAAITTSNLPDSVDMAFWDNWLIDLYSSNNEFEFWR